MAKTTATGLPKRNAVLDSVPPKGRKGTNLDLDMWEAEIAELRQTADGTAFEYKDVANPAKIAQQLRKRFEIKVVSRNVDPETKVGNLYLVNESPEDDNSYTDVPE